MRRFALAREECEAGADAAKAESASLLAELLAARQELASVSI